MISRRIDSFMATTQNTYWQGIEMLPVMHEYIAAELNDAMTQLETLVSMKNEPYELEPFIAETIFTRYSDKIVQRYQIEEQCRVWRSIKLLNIQQLETIIRLENNLTLSNKLSQQILFFVEHFKQAEVLEDNMRQVVPRDFYFETKH